MQRGFECPVCTEVYDTKTRVPKTLVACGHGVCEPCIRSLLSATPGPDITCPTCRTQCLIPDGQTSKLPTNYPILGLLDSLCAECMDRKHTQRCGHCPLNLCHVCRENHNIMTLPDLSDNLRELKVLTEHLQDLINQDKEFHEIKERGDRLIEEMKKTHKERICQLEQEHEKNIARVKAEILQNTRSLIDWRGKLTKLVMESKLFLDEQQLTTQLHASVTHQDSVNTQQECQQKMAALRQIEAAKPDPSHLSMGYKDVNMERLVASCRAIVISQQTQTDGNTTSNILQVPDYTKATYKAMYDSGLKEPINICTDPVSGNVVITDYNQHNVLVLTDTLQLVHMFGSHGQGTGEYNYPLGVAVYDGNIYICDQGNHRIHVTDTQGTELYKFGSGGSGRDQYNRPLGLSVDTCGLLYVCDAGNKRIKVTDRRGRYIREYGRDVVGDEEPWFIAISTDDKVAMSTNNGNIYMFTTNGQHIKTIKGNTPPNNIDARGLWFDGHGNLLVSDCAGGRVAVMSESAEVKCVIGTQGTGLGQLRGPLGVSVTREGGVIVCDVVNNRIQLFNVPQS